MNKMRQYRISPNPTGRGVELNKTKGAAPLYMQIHDLFVERISVGDWAPGDLIPSELQLSRELGVSQGTVRQAISELVENNVLMRKQGRGTFVAHHDNERSLFHFFHIADRHGHKALPESETLSFRRKQATRGEQSRLGLSDDTAVWVIQRLRKFDDRPTLVETITLPHALFPTLGDTDARALPNALYEMYEKRFGVTIHRAREALRAIAASPRDAALLDVAEGTPLLEIERVALTLDETPVELRRSRCLTDKHHYQNTIF